MLRVIFLCVFPVLCFLLFMFCLLQFSLHVFFWGERVRVKCVFLFLFICFLISSVLHIFFFPLLLLMRFSFPFFFLLSFFRFFCSC